MAEDGAEAGGREAEGGGAGTCWWVGVWCGREVDGDCSSVGGGEVVRGSVVVV